MTYFINSPEVPKNELKRMMLHDEGELVDTSNSTSKVVIEGNDELWEQIKAFHRVLSRSVDYPQGLCGDARSLLASVGLRKAGGWFEVDHLSYPASYRFKLEPHGWAEDSVGTRVELVGEQFNSGLIEPFPKGPVIIKPGSPLYNRYIPAGKIADFSRYYNPR